MKERILRWLSSVPYSYEEYAGTYSGSEMHAFRFFMFLLSLNAATMLAGLKIAFGWDPWRAGPYVFAATIVGLLVIWKKIRSEYRSAFSGEQRPARHARRIAVGCYAVGSLVVAFLVFWLALY